MLNTNPLNTLAVNEINAPSSVAQGLLVIGGLDISSGSYGVTDIQDLPISDVSGYDIPQNNGKGFLSSFQRGRNITMNVYISWEDKNEFIKNLDAFKKACYTENTLLEWRYDDEIRKTKVNCVSNPSVFNNYNINFIEVKVSFVAYEPFWYKDSYQSTSVFSQTADFQEEISTIGTAESEVVAYILFWATNTTQVKMEIWENEIVIDHAFSDNDILKIDGENKRIYLWGQKLDYSGIFPYMSPGQNFFKFTINGTFTCDVLILNKKTYV